MHRILLATVLACSGCLLPVVRADPAVIDWQPAPLDARSLEADLEGHGAWLELPGLGRVWQPAVAYVGADFYPYGSGGRWMLTEAGWVFDSDYPFGWATFHYGRWVLEPAYGWVWVPGSAWAPSWVAWRAGGAFVGCAALGPEGEPPLGAARWTFIERGHLLSMNPHRGALPAVRFEEAATTTAPLRLAAARQGPSPTFVSAGTRQALTPRSMASVPSTGRAAPPAPTWRTTPSAPALRDWPPEAPAAPPPAAAVPGASHGSRAAATRRAPPLAPLASARATAEAPEGLRVPSSHRQAASAPTLTALRPARSVEFLRVP